VSRRRLVVVRCGRGSRHPAWLAGSARTFDLCLCPYEEVPFAGDVPGPDRPIPGQKWTGLAAFLGADRRWRGYDRIWLPDDDLEATAEGLTRFFDLCDRHDAALAQPALEEGSEASHLVTLHNRAFAVRTTTFVELMAPCFRRDVLERLLPTFAGSTTGYGWGLDDAWARLLGYDGLFVTDAATVGHHRPVGTARSAADARAAKAEMKAIRRRHGATSRRKTTGGERSDGTWVREADPSFVPLLEEGWGWFLASRPEDLARLRRHQAAGPEA
jgi:hypothetical protein